MEIKTKIPKVCFNCRLFQNGLARCYAPPKERYPDSSCDNEKAYIPERFASTRAKSNQTPST
jgi:hypothetical protein